MRWKQRGRKEETSRRRVRRMDTLRHFQEKSHLPNPIQPSMGFPGSSAGKDFTCKAGHPGSIPGLERSSGEGIGCPFHYSWASLVAQTIKNPFKCRRPGFDSWVGKIPWRRARQPTPVFLPGESHGQRNLAGYSPWGHKESDMTEQLSTAHEMSRWVESHLLFLPQMQRETKDGKS